jgi:hypothetical protein
VPPRVGRVNVEPRDALPPAPVSLWFAASRP